MGASFKGLPCCLCSPNALAPQSISHSLAPMRDVTKKRKDFYQLLKPSTVFRMSLQRAESSEVDPGPHVRSFHYSSLERECGCVRMADGEMEKLERRKHGPRAGSAAKAPCESLRRKAQPSGPSGSFSQAPGAFQPAGRRPAGFSATCPGVYDVRGKNFFLLQSNPLLPTISLPWLP